MSEKNQDKLLYVHKVAAILECSKRHVYRLIECGHLKAVRIGLKGLRIYESSLNKFIETRKIKPQDYFA